jgi:hypothetical protein
LSRIGKPGPFRAVDTRYFIRWYFADRATAETFAAEFSGTLVDALMANDAMRGAVSGFAQGATGLISAWRHKRIFPVRQVMSAYLAQAPAILFAYLFLCPKKVRRLSSI